MKRDWTGRPYATAVVLCILLTPLAYLVSAPPVFHVASRWYTGKGEYHPSWCWQMMEPYFWLRVNTPLRRPLEDYYTWWWRRLDPVATPGGSPWLK
jgi:hypothetical protein